MASEIRVDQFKTTAGSSVMSSDGTNLSVQNNLVMQSGTRLDLPTWDNSTRPATPVAGSIGYNTEIGVAESYDGTNWIAVGATSYPTPVQAGLVAHWDANKTNGYNGTTWTDHSGVTGNVNIQNRSSDWTFQTEASTGLVCVYNNSDRAGGSNPGIAVPTANFPKGHGTIEMWLRPTSATGGCGWYVNGDGTSYTNNTNWFWFGEWDNGNCFYHRQGASSQGCCGNDNSGCVSWSTNVMPRNTWHHVVLTWVSNASPYESKIYVNNSLYQTKTVSTDITSSDQGWGGQLFNGHNRSDNMQYKGYCSIYRIYNRALTTAEITLNYNAFKGLHGL